MCDRVVVLLALHNGEKYLIEQMQSYCTQSLKPMLVLGSDDGSSDETKRLFMEFASNDKSGIIWKLIDGPRRGVTENYLHLIRELEKIDFEYAALSDQDDIWLPNKIRNAVEIISDGGDIPILFGSRSIIWKNQDGSISLSKNVKNPLSFGHSIVQNFSSGNTMVMNKRASLLAVEAANSKSIPIIHDWWLYQIISGAGGLVLWDKRPEILYRQHSENLIGSPNFVAKTIKSAKKIYNNYYLECFSVNMFCLLDNIHILTPEAIKILRAMDKKGKHNRLDAVLSMRRHGIHKKGFFENLLFLILVFSRRV